MTCRSTEIIETAAPLGGSLMSRMSATLTNAEYRAAKRALRANAARRGAAIGARAT